MKYKRITFFLSVCFLTFQIQILKGQAYCDIKYNYIWIMGGIDIDTTADIHGGFEINFHTNPPSFLKHPKYYRNYFQNASMSSREGDLIFYSNGCIVLNALDEQMENGDSLNPGEIYEENCPDYGYFGFQNMLVLPDSYNDSIYYLFHIDLKFNNDPDIPFTLIPENLLYSTIDISENLGKGAVINKNQIILRDTTMLGGPLTAVKHGNGLDWWVICPNRWTNSFNIILVNETGPTFVGRQYIGIIPDSSSIGGQGKFSPDGSKFAWYHPANGLFIYNFDRENGELSNFKRIEIPSFSGVTGGLEFSALGNFLYVNHDTSLFQVDVRSKDIQLSLVHIADYDNFVDITATPFYHMERTPNNKIFLNILGGSPWLHVIQEPDKKGAACRFEQHSLRLPTINNFTLPHYPNYQLGNLSEPPCDTGWVTTLYPKSLPQQQFKITPNPISGYIKIHQIAGEPIAIPKIVITDINGYPILRFFDWEADLSGIPAGIYICKIHSGNDYIQVEKIAIK